jgi:hypothetical protein
MNEERGKAHFELFFPRLLSSKTQSCPPFLHLYMSGKEDGEAYNVSCGDARYPRLRSRRSRKGRRQARTLQGGDPSSGRRHFILSLTERKWVMSGRCEKDEGKGERRRKDGPTSCIRCTLWIKRRRGCDQLLFYCYTLEGDREKEPTNLLPRVALTFLPSSPTSPGFGPAFADDPPALGPAFALIRALGGGWEGGGRDGLKAAAEGAGGAGREGGATSSLSSSSSESSSSSSSPDGEVEDLVEEW